MLPDFISYEYEVSNWSLSGGMRLKYRECVAQSRGMLLNHPNNKNKSCIRLKHFIEPRNMKHCGIKYMIKSRK